MSEISMMIHVSYIKKMINKAVNSIFMRNLKMQKKILNNILFMKNLIQFLINSLYF